MELPAWTQKFRIRFSAVTWIGFFCVLGLFLGYAFLLNEREQATQDLLRAELRYLRAENTTLVDRIWDMEQRLSAGQQGEHSGNSENPATTDPNALQKTQQSFVYTVKKGDTIWDIAMTYQVDVNALMQWNNLTAKSRIYPGDTVTIILEE